MGLLWGLNKIIHTNHSYSTVLVKILLFFFFPSPATLSLLFFPSSSSSSHIPILLCASSPWTFPLVPLLLGTRLCLLEHHLMINKLWLPWNSSLDSHSLFFISPCVQYIMITLFIMGNLPWFPHKAAASLTALSIENRLYQPTTHSAVKSELCVFFQPKCNLQATLPPLSCIPPSFFFWVSHLATPWFHLSTVYSFIKD